MDFIFGPDFGALHLPNKLILHIAPANFIFGMISYLKIASVQLKSHQTVDNFTSGGACEMCQRNYIQWQNPAKYIRVKCAKETIIQWQNPPKYIRV